MRLSKEQKFLYSRVAILVAGVGLVVSALAGWKGLLFWHIGFALCLWLLFALQNFPYKTSLWMFMHRRIPFLIFYGTLAGSFILFDQLALRLHLWFYPFYHDLWFIFLYGMLFPIAALAQLECFYFLTHLLQEPLTFKQHKATSMHRLLDAGEGVLFLLMILLITLGAAGYSISPAVLFVVATLWMLFTALKLGFHITHSAHLILLLVIVAVIAALLNELRGTAAFEWVYLEAPTLNAPLWNIPLWMWLGSFWYVLFTLRLWIFFVLHPRIK